MTEDRWNNLLSLSESQRQKKYAYWWKVEVANVNEKLKQEKRQQKHQEKLQTVKKLKEEGLWQLKNTYLFFTREATMNHWYSNNLYHAMQHGPHLLFDCGFENKMTDHELSEFCAQLQLSFAFNKVHSDPFHLIFCNFHHGGKTGIMLEKHLPNYNAYPMTFTNKHYLDLFPKDRLVYLSPNSRTVLSEYNEDDVYIVGGIVDKAAEEPLTFAKSKREGIRTAKFPLDHYLR